MRSIRFVCWWPIVALVVTPVLHAQIPVWSKDGPIAQAAVGRSVVVIGDIDSDGTDDVLIGSPSGVGATPLATPSSGAAGHVYVVSGKTGAEIASYSGVQGAMDLFGFGVTGCGDIDLDGFVDIAVGAPRADAPINLAAGSVAVYSGASGALRYRVLGLSGSEAFGAVVVGIGDTNFDGIPEILATAPYADPTGKIDAGAARVLFGANGFVAKTLSGANTLDHFGAAAATLPGVAAAASTPFIVGAPEGLFGAALRPGMATIYSGAATFVSTSYGNSDGDRYGASFATIDDSDGDSIADILIGAPGADTGLADCGRVFIHSYTLGLLAIVVGDQSGLGLGTVLARSTDFSGDGAPDVVSGTALGEVEFRTLTGSVLGSYSYPGEFGRAVAGIEDIDGDGRGDYVVGAPSASENGIDGSGRAGIWPGPAPFGLPGFSKGTLTFVVSAGVELDSQQIEITNKGFGSVSYKLQKPSDAAWLVLSKTTGTLSTLGKSDVIEIDVDVAKLTTAETTTVVSLVDASTQAVYGQLVVGVESGGSGASPDLCVSTNEWNVLTAVGGAPLQPSVLTVSNCGNPALTMSYAAQVVEPDATWLSITPSQGSLLPGGPSIPLNVTYDISGLSPGVYTAHLRIGNGADPNDFEIVTVSLSLISSFLVPGQKGKGTIADSADTDEALFFGIAGMELVVTGGPKNGFKPRLTLIDPNGDTYDTWVPANNKTKKSLLLDTSGAWLLRVSGDGATGSYQFKTKRGFLPPSAKASTKTITANDTLPITLEVLALPGCRLDAKVSTKTQPIGDLSVAFASPNGTQFDVAQFDSVVNSTYTVKKLPLASIGTYRISVSGLQFGKQMKVVLEPTQPAAGTGSVVMD